MVGRFGQPSHVQDKDLATAFAAQRETCRELLMLLAAYLQQAVLGLKHIQHPKAPTAPGGSLVKGKGRVGPWHELAMTEQRSMLCCNPGPSPLASLLETASSQ